MARATGWVHAVLGTRGWLLPRVSTQSHQRRSLEKVRSAASLARASRAGAHRRGPLPPYRYPAPAAPAVLAVTHPVTGANESGRAVLARRGFCRRTKITVKSAPAYALRVAHDGASRYS